MDERNPIPRHVAIIMDGNGRWAEMRGLPRHEGHLRGVESVRTTVRSAVRCGVRCLTLYAFSTENWGRPADEVEGLMELFCTCVAAETPELLRQGVRIRMIGDRSRFSEKVRRHLEQAERATEACDRLTLVLALDYSARSELVHAARTLARRTAAGAITPEAIDERTVAEALWTADIPDPDLIVRTSGEQRLSNFLLWQAAYAELWFPEVLWPDFGEEEFDRALAEYARRDRRFGRLK